MHPYRFLVAALLLLALAGAGCTSRGPAEGEATGPQPPAGGLVPVGGGAGEEEGTDGADGNGTAKARPSPATLNLSRDPVDIRDGGDLSNGASKDWAWHVAPGFKTFTLELMLEGPQGTPLYTALDLSIRLQGGDPAQTHADVESTLWMNSPGCAVCLDGAELEGAAGQWTLHFGAGPSPAAYSVRVAVTY